MINRKSSWHIRKILSFSFLLVLPFILYSCTKNSEDPEKVYPDKNINGNSPSEGIIFFSFNNGKAWENQSMGLPEDIVITDLSSSVDNLILSSKRHGIFTYDIGDNTWNNILTNPVVGKDIDVVSIINDTIYAGTGGDGVFISTDKGKTWKKYNDGLENLTIRRFALIKDKVFAGTNSGLYSFNYIHKKWEYEFGSGLQVNGITASGDDIFAGTNKGIFKFRGNAGIWEIMNKKLSLHNISSSGNRIYAMAYNELFYSADKGKTWLSGQDGLPPGLYTFQIKEKETSLFAAQWTGIYIKTGSGNWTPSSEGLPLNFAVTELAIFNNIIAAGGTGAKIRNKSIMQH